ncbi:hypothetical protein Forpe1208_v011054 [Fusarium oxysporum f. sp. rapae]|uniref:Uncharacterized protein n=1 Tax=Fusarium oxysporum f. sp. rapae TaxID=485398 RepID=A0A8J5U4R3_FUSOX|nr:hypothetical protein Forpe1208_v011054 [Fusarium oxysporum f. sp. rapae]
MRARLPHPRRQQVLSAPLAEIADTHAEMTDTDASCKRNTVSPMRSIDTRAPAQDLLSKLTVKPSIPPPLLLTPNQGKQEAFNAARDASVSYINSPHDEVDAHYLSNHRQNGLMQDTNLTSRLAKACDFELAASEPTETAKARVISIGRMWEGKMRDLPDEMAAACDELHARSQVLDEWESVAKDEDW